MKARKQQNANSAGVRPLIINRIESVSKNVFKRYFPLITELVGDSPGIYALYDGDELYYVGKSTELRKRVKHHLKDRHLASWSHFSLYLARREEHIHEIESLLVRIANPKGNRVIPRGKSRGTLLKQLKRAIQQRQKDEISELFGTGRRVRKSRPGIRKNPTKSLEGLVSKKTTLYHKYKGTEHKATLSPDGVITYGGKKYESPSGAARAARGGSKPVNGWTWWYVESPTGDWVRLGEYKE